MRKTRPEDFDPRYKEGQGPEPEEIDMEGVAPIKAKPSPPTTDDDVEDGAAEARRSNDHMGKGTREQTGERREKATEDESKHASLQASKRANNQTSLQTKMQASMRALLNEKATKAATFRYPLELLEKLDDALHTARKGYRHKLTKNEIAVTALLFLLLDFETYGRESVLYQTLIEKEE